MNIIKRSTAYADGRTSFLGDVAKGRIIFRQGDPALFRFEVTSGVIRTTYLFADGRRQVVGFFFGGEVFGTDKGCHKTTAEVVSERAEVNRICWGDPAADECALNSGMGLLESSILLLGRRTALNRVAAFIADIQSRAKAARQVPLPMSRVDIADYLGLTVETVSRTFSQLMQKGIVAQPGIHLVRIIDQHGLNALAGVENDTEFDVERRSAKQ